MWALFVVQNYREKPDGALKWSPFLLPDFVGIGNLWATPAALFSGAIGIALVKNLFYAACRTCPRC